jgi:hypothetical protein
MSFRAEKQVIQRLRRLALDLLRIHQCIDDFEMVLVAFVCLEV